ncbi:MAG: Gfo/Idh/MocA family oxidoreductase [Clostridiales bacterium]|nr:Gfo/Idh/MocA family oxidoreductase [Clostridiales bacterium]
MNFAIIGLGGRGSVYAHYINEYGARLVAVCDINADKYSLAAKYGVSENGFFTDESEFFKRGKIADALVISTMDGLHYEQAMRALDFGYDILLEKPIALTLEQCKSIERKAIQTGRKVVVCHVLRYAPIYIKLKELIESKKLGDVVSLSLTEEIGYYHFAHSYVRGNWRNTDVSTPLIVAKNCHDLDIICWFLDRPCLSVSSVGGLYEFKPDKAPLSSAARCVDCPLKEECKYSCFKLYTNAEYEKCAGLAAHANLGRTAEEICAALGNTHTPYGRCVYRCDNNVCDHQTVNMLFDGGVTAQLLSTAFSENICRNSVVYFTDGKAYSLPDGNIAYEKFGGEKGTIEVEKVSGGYAHHGGGDVGIVKEFISYVQDGVKPFSITDISRSVQSHEIAFAAEQSRLKNGKTLFMNGSEK